MRRLRQYHHYAGLFFAPAILLFALSGALQTFRLQEEKGYGAKPPGWIVWMASVHKDQSWPRPKKPRARAEAPHTPDAPPRPGKAAPERASTLPLKIFVVLLSIGLIVSTILGMIIALNNRAMRRTSILLLLGGSAIPVLLLLL